jgi:lipoprotein-anchoring transpeptidase ErfK/SrfK
LLALTGLVPLLVLCGCATSAGHPASLAPRESAAVQAGRFANSHPAGSAAGGPARTGEPATVTATPFRPRVSTLLATTHGAVPKFAFPGGPRNGQVPGSWHRAPSVLPVIGQRPGWLKVRLAQRPNEATAWILSRDATLTTTPYAIVLDLAATRLTLYRDGHSVFSAPAGIGTRQDPTPAGTFFVAFFAAPPAPAYGAFVIVTSAHSNVITDWDMSGDAMVAIHAALGGDAQIGTTGARVSHGCIRLHENDLLRLRDVPAGSPVIILAS